MPNECREASQQKYQEEINANIQQSCELIDIQGSGIYEMTGTVANPSWTKMGTAAPSSITLASKKMLYGGATNVATESVFLEWDTTGSADVLKVGDTDTQTRGGKIWTFRDNGSTFSLGGLTSVAEGATFVQSYGGIFYNDAYTTIGTLKTKMIVGGNLEFDVQLQSPCRMLRLRYWFRVWT